MRWKPVSTVALAACLITTVAAVAAAAIVNVPADQPTIQAGITAAAPGDTVLVAPDTYQETIDFLGKPIVVASWYLTTGDPAHVSGTVLDGGGVVRGALVTMNSGEDSLSVLAGLTLRDGHALNGAGVYCRNASPRISDCVFLSNEAQNYGGGVYGWQASPIVEGCRFEENDAGYSGGGLTVYYGSPRIAGNTFVGNTANSTGGALFIEETTALVCDNVIEANAALSTYGGGIMSRNCAPVIVRNVIAHNVTNGYGGGLFY